MTQTQTSAACALPASEALAAGAAGPAGPLDDRRTYVVDTSVLLSDPGSYRRFGEHDVVLPVVVVTELESKRSHPELGWAARRVLHGLEDLRELHGGLTEPAVVNAEGGTVRVELNHRDTSTLPQGLADSSNDARILAVAHNLSCEGHDVVLVSKDLPLRLRAGLAGLCAEQYRNEQIAESSWTGMEHIDVSAEQVNALYSDGDAMIEAAAELPVNTGVVLAGSNSSALGRVTADKSVRLIRSQADVFGVHGRSAEQRIALDLLSDESVGIVSMGGNAGTGKSVLALAAGLEAVLERRSHSKIMVFRPIYAVGGQDLGFMPGTEAEKMRGWGMAVFDALEAIASPTVVEEVVAQGKLEVLPLTHIRGRSLHDAFVIVDEAQNLERTVLLTALTRLGNNTRCVLTHDVAQRDNLRVGRHDGILSVVELLKGHPLFGHVTLARSERSAVAALVNTLLEGDV